MITTVLRKYIFYFKNIGMNARKELNTKLRLKSIFNDHSVGDGRHGATRSGPKNRRYRQDMALCRDPLLANLLK